jgi:hypothetical protein
MTSSPGWTPTVGGELRLERPVLLAMDVPTTLEHAGHGGVHLALERLILRASVEDRD